MEKISGFIISYNEEHCIETSILSLKKFCDEIIILDSFSTDKTIDIAKKHNCKVYQHEIDSFCLQKNRALNYCTNDWVFNLDADEYCDDELINEIQNIIQVAKENDADVCQIQLINFLDDKFLSGPEFKNRLFNTYRKFFI